MERRLYRYIWRHSYHEQFTVLAIILVSMPIYFLSLTLPKLIVNGPIDGRGFELSPEIIHYAVHLPSWAGGGVIFPGIALDRVEALLALSFTFLGLVAVNGMFKYNINVMKGRMGERLLRRLRFELVDRVLRFYPARLKRANAAETATMIKDEVEPLGGFVGEAFVTPAYLGGQALTALFFIMMQDLMLGLVAGLIVVFQALLIPYLRGPLLSLARQRQLTARQLSGRVGEIVDAGAVIHANDTSNYERADIAGRLSTIFDIRFAIYRRKFFVKFLNNFMSQVTPFFFYALGGYLVIKGDLSIGALVAVIAAYKDLPAPVKELLDWWLDKQDAQVKYEQVIEQFAAEKLIPAELHAPVPVNGPINEVRLDEAVAADDAGAVLADRLNLTLPAHQHVAFRGPPGGGKEAAAGLIARQIYVKSGAVLIDGRNIETLPQAVTGRRIAYVAQDGYVFGESLRGNLLYGLRNAPPCTQEDAAEATRRALAEARKSGNPEFDWTSDWVDYKALGLKRAEDADEHLMHALSIAGMARDSFRLGLQGRFSAQEAPDIAERLLEARLLFKQREHVADIDTVEPFDEALYNNQATIGENLLFGMALSPEFAPEALSQNRLVADLLEDSGLEAPLFTLGRGIAETMIEIFQGLPPDHPFFEQFSFIAAADLPKFAALLARNAEGQALSKADRARILGLSFAYSERRHRLGLLEDELRSMILAGRALFNERLPASARAKIAFYDKDHYNDAASVEDNILFGRVVYGVPDAQRRIDALLQGVIADLKLGPAIARIGLNYHCGAAGKRLTPAQRQRVALARALVKDPDILVVNGALAVLDPAAQNEIMAAVLKARHGRGVVWTLTPQQDASAFERVVTFEHGQIAHDELRTGQAEHAA